VLLLWGIPGVVNNLVNTSMLAIEFGEKRIVDPSS
jgi:hypothetical protein